MCKNGSLWDSLWLIRLPSFAECQTGPTWLQWDSYTAVCWPSELNLSQLVCAVRHPVQVFVVRIPDGFSLSWSERRTWNGGTRIYICCWKGIYRAVCPEPCCETLVRHWLNTEHKIPEQKPLCFEWQGRWYTLSVKNCTITLTHGVFLSSKIYLSKCLSSCAPFRFELRAGRSGQKNYPISRHW